MRKDKWFAKASYRAPALTRTLIQEMQVPFSFVLMLWEEQLPLLSKLFPLGVNSTDWKMIPALALILFVTILLLPCCSSRDHGPWMCLCQELAFQPSTLPGLSRKMEGRAGGSLGQHLPFPAQHVPDCLHPCQHSSCRCYGQSSLVSREQPRGSLALASRAGPREETSSQLEMWHHNQLSPCREAEESQRPSQICRNRWWTHFFAHK